MRGPADGENHSPNCTQDPQPQKKKRLECPTQRFMYQLGQGCLTHRKPYEGVNLSPADIQGAKPRRRRGSAAPRGGRAGWTCKQQQRV